MKNNFNLVYQIYEESQYIKRLPYICNKWLQFDNSMINVIQNRNDLKKWLLATSDYGRELQEELNAVVGYNEKFNNAIVRHALDRKDASFMQNPNPLNLTFLDVKKFDMQNPIIGKITTQIKASKLTEDQLTKRILLQDQIADIENRLEKLKRPIKDSGDEGAAEVLKEAEVLAVYRLPLYRLPLLENINLVQKKNLMMN